MNPFVLAHPLYSACSWPASCAGGGLCHGTPAAKPGKAAAGNRVTLDFKEIELTDLIQTISELTGQNFLYDDTVRGKVTLDHPRGDDP